MQFDRERFMAHVQVAAADTREMTAEEHVSHAINDLAILDALQDQRAADAEADLDDLVTLGRSQAHALLAIAKSLSAEGR